MAPVKSPSVPHVIRDNGDGTWAVIFNPTSKVSGRCVWQRERYVIPNCANRKRAIQSALELAQDYDFNTHEVKEE